MGQRSFLIDSSFTDTWVESIDCEVSAWSEWTSCSKPCGFGESQRARIIKREADHGGIPCPVLQATKSCNDFHCPVNCTVSAWSEWSSCSKSCHWGNPGQIRRGRDVLTQPTYSGASCPVLDDTKTCNDF